MNSLGIRPNDQLDRRSGNERGAAPTLAVAATAEGLMPASYGAPMPMYPLESTDDMESALQGHTDAEEDLDEDFLPCGPCCERKPKRRLKPSRRTEGDYNARDWD